jgi:hypothetical protein
MYTVTFYSYRGGVGRTTTLKHVAQQLAMRRRNVLVVDFNFDAPDLDSDTPHVGLVEFIDEYQRLHKVPDVRDYVSTKEFLRSWSERWGNCLVMPAGRCDDDYWAARARIDWQNLYAAGDGFCLFEDLKAQWREQFNPDYVLIEAPAGICETTGICTRQLPDAVVMMFVPDNYADEGFHRVLTDIYQEADDHGPGRIEVLLAACKLPDPELAAFGPPAGEAVGGDDVLDSYRELGEDYPTFDLCSADSRGTGLVARAGWPLPPPRTGGRSLPPPGPRAHPAQLYRRSPRRSCVLAETTEKP